MVLFGSVTKVFLEVAMFKNDFASPIIPKLSKQNIGIFIPKEIGSTMSNAYVKAKAGMVTFRAEFDKFKSHASIKELQNYIYIIIKCDWEIRVWLQPLNENDVTVWFNCLLFVLTIAYA